MRSNPAMFARLKNQFNQFLLHFRPISLIIIKQQSASLAWFRVTPLCLTVLSACSNIPAAAPLLVVFAVLGSVAASPQLALQGPLAALCWLHLGQTKKKKTHHPLSFQVSLLGQVKEARVKCIVCAAALSSNHKRASVHSRCDGDLASQEVAKVHLGVTSWMLLSGSCLGI